jgi:hypothetical protein
MLLFKSIVEVGCQATSCKRLGWFKKLMPNLKQQVMPKKGWGNAQDMQT